MKTIIWQRKTRQEKTASEEINTDDVNCEEPCEQHRTGVTKQITIDVYICVVLQLSPLRYPTTPLHYPSNQ